MDYKTQKVTIQDVARASGVSVTTVSRVLNDKQDVSASTQVKVRRVINELGYTSNLAARSMRSRKTNVIGVILPDMYQAFSIEVVKGVNRAVVESGFDLIAYTSGRRGDKALADWEQQQVALISSSITDGVIVATPRATIFRTEAPLVAVDPHSEGAEFPSVIATNRVGVLDAMTYLTDLGHRRIGFIGGRADLVSSHRRLLGYKDGLARAGIEFNAVDIAEGDFTEQTGYSSALKLLARSDRVTALLAANDASAIGAMTAAKEIGLSIPNDLSIVGFDNVPATRLTEPPLTTVDQPIETMGYTAATMLLELIAGRALEESVRKVKTKLVVRDSCREVNPERILA